MMVELTRLSGYLSFVDIDSIRSHSIVKESHVDERWKARLTMVLTSDYLYRLSTWLWWWSSRPVSVLGLPINTGFHFAAFL